MAEKSLFEILGADKIIKGLKWGWDAARWRKAWHDYAKHVEEDYGKLFVLGKANAVPMDDIYTAVKVLEKPQALRRFAPEELHKLFLERQALWREDDKRQSGIELIADAKNYFILGKPGAGKTTFLKNVAIKAVKGNFHSQKTDDVLPIFISLKEHVDSGRSLLESIEHELSICQFPEVRPFVNLLLHSGKAVILLDALDEVKQEGDTRSGVITNIKELMREYRESQFLITCRVAATEYEFDNVTYIEMADFDDDQIEKFIHNWFDDEDQGKTCWQELLKDDNKGLQEMARVPLLLTLLAMNYEETQTFPQRRVEIYEEALDALLKKWDARRQIKRDEPYKALSLGRKRQMFARVAAETFEEKNFLPSKTALAEKLKGYMEKVPEVEGDIDGEVVLEAIAAQHGIFVERARNIYSFAHLSFQEYYTAKYIVDNASRGALEGLLEHINEDQWREVFLLTTSLLDEEVANKFFEIFLARLTELTEKNEQIQALLECAKQNTEATSSKIRYKTFALRVRLSVKLAQTLNYNSIFGDSLKQTHASIISTAPNVAMVIDLALELDENLFKASALDLILNLGVDHGSFKIDSARKFARELGLETMEQKLSKLVVPSEDTPDWEWEAFDEFLSEVYDEYKEFSGLNLFNVSYSSKNLNWSKESSGIFSTYYEANQLLVDCLNLAIVTDRDAILNQLFLPTSEQ